MSLRCSQPEEDLGGVGASDFEERRHAARVQERSLHAAEVVNAAVHRDPQIVARVACAGAMGFDSSRDGFPPLEIFGPP